MPPAVQRAEPASGPKVSPILAVIDRMMAAPAAERAPEPARNPHAGAAAASAPVAVLGPKELSVERPAAAKDALDEAAELFKTVFKGDIVP